MLNALRAGVLDDVRHRLLDDPVQRRLDRLGQPHVADPRLDVNLDSALADRLGETLDRRNEPEVVERARAQLHREPAHVLERRDDLLPEGDDRLARLAARRLLERLEPEQDRRQRLAGLVVQLAREALALELLRLHDTSDRLAADALREVDGPGRPGGERLREPQVVVVEARVGPGPVVGERLRRSHVRRPRAERTGPYGRRAGEPRTGRPRDPRGPSRPARSWRARGSRPDLEWSTSSVMPTIP